MAAAGLELYGKVCTVDAVDEDARTVDCTPIDEGAPLLSVNLQANQESEDGVVLLPAVGSYVVVSFLESSVAVVVLTEKVDKIDLKIGDTTAQLVDGRIDIAVQDSTVKISPDGVFINGGNFGGMIKIKELTQKLNDLIAAFNSHTHELSTGAVAVTGSATAQANPAPVVVPAISSQHPSVSVSDYEDEKVKH
jgi:hypothetical protein